MYAINPIKGDELPDKILCLTYDDGPGEHTLPIAEFLSEHNIRATFFVVGKYAVEQQSILARLKKMGHIIGNHTYDHPDLPYYVSVNGDLQGQVLHTHAVIKPYTSQPVFFRAPYGKWSPEVASELNANLQCAINHIGPIHWDIAGIDCYYWHTGKSLEEAVNDYKKAINEAGKGIVVMHDDTADMDIVKPLNQTPELTRRLIPILLSEGYRFIGLDEVIALQNASEAFKIRLRTVDGKFVNLPGNSGPSLSVKPTLVKTTFIVEVLTEGKIALKTTSGKYVSLTTGNEIQAVEDGLFPKAKFDFIPVFDDRFVLRTHTGHFVNLEAKTGSVVAAAPFMRQATIFRYQPVHLPVRKPVSMKMQFQLWKKRVAFIKSKLSGR